MNPRRIIAALGLALIVSGSSTWLVSRRLSTPPAPVKLREILYVAPARALDAGEVMSSANTELVAWPGTQPMDGAFQQETGVLGREVLFPLAKGQPILDRDLSTPGAGLGLANKIPNGLRAVTLRSDEVVGVAGFLAPGSHLDVLATYRSQSASEPLTATVLQDVVVVAAGHQTEPDPSGKILDAAVVTLLLTPEQSQRAVLASAEGAIHFVLRNGGDDSEDKTEPLSLSQLTGRSDTALPGRRMPTLAVSQAPPAPKRHEIEMVFGGGAGEPRAAEGGHGQ